MDTSTPTPFVQHNLTLTIMSLLTLLLAMFHIADDIRIEVSPPGYSNITVLVIMVVWLYATLALAGRRSGYILTGVLSLLGAAVPIIHMGGSNGMLGPHLMKAGGVFFFVWTLLALGTTATYSVILSVQGLWRGRRAS